AYGMTTEEMLKMLEDWMATLRTLYLQLHTWAKYKLAEKFHQPVPKKIPAHWINNRWGQEWPGLVEAADIDKHFKDRKPEWIIKTAEQFYTGLGFSPLPQSFWERSDLYPLPPDSKRKKNTHAAFCPPILNRTGQHFSSTTHSRVQSRLFISPAARCRIGKRIFTRTICPLISGTRAGGNTFPIFRASSRHRRVAKSFVMPLP